MDEANILHEIVARVLGMDAAIFSRFHIMKCWPWLLVTDVVPTVPREEATNMRGQVLRAHTCCLDAWFSEWFVGMLPNVDAFDE